MSKLTNEKELGLTIHGRSYLPGLLRIQLLLIVLWSPFTLAQHEIHNMPATAALNSMPASDEILAAAPASLMLHFGSQMRLVKLALKAREHGYVNINFRYQPAPGVHFMQSLPMLASANYYTVEWAAFNSNEQLIKGSFHFSFGDDARQPSYYLDQMKHPDHIMSPDYRLL